MSREIKFRGIVSKVPSGVTGNYEVGQWVYGDLLQWPTGEREIIIYVGDSDADKLTVIPETVGQFIGLVTPKDIEIYQGDKFIAKWPPEYGAQEVTEESTVIYQFDGYCDTSGCPIGVILDCAEFTITGTIHDHLLKP